MPKNNWIFTWGVCLAILTLGLLLDPIPRRVAGSVAGPQADSPAGHAFRITLGFRDTQPRDWSGRISLSSGNLSRLEGWHFAGEDKVEGASWNATSKKPAPSRAANPATPALVDPLGILAVGVEAVVDATETCRVTVSTKGGEFAFDLKELAFGRPLEFLEGAALVERQPVAARVTAPEFEDDHSSMAVTPDGAVALAWLGYRDRKDEVFLRLFRNGRWSETARVTPGGGDFFRTALASDEKGRMWIVWSQQDNGNWELMGRRLDRPEDLSSIGATQAFKLSENAQPDIFHSLASDSAGRIALVWMSFRNGQSDIYLKNWDGNAWSNEIRVSESSANDWEPSVAIDSKGKVWVAWDSYERGSYNILLRSITDGKPGNLIRITDSPRYHARASVAAGAAERVWVAWEESEANWGKDYGYWTTSTPWQGAGNPLYRSRSVRVAVLEDEVLKFPAHDLMESVPQAMRAYVQMPQLVSDTSGRIWAFLRIRSFVRTETSDVWASGGRWNVFLTAHAGDRWIVPIPFPKSVAANHVRIGAARAPDGSVWTAWPTDGRLFANPPQPVPAAPNLTPNTLQGFGAVPQNYEIFTARVDPSLASFGAPLSGPKLVIARPDLAASAPVHPEEEIDVRRIRTYEIRSGGKSYRIYRGDMHRHTDISADGAGDGSVMDLFRYALDAARMDYAMVNDHNSGFDQEYSWWRIEKADDLFYIPGSFATLFGYERSLGYPNGHRNLAFAQRGVRTLPAARGEQPRQGNVEVNSGSVLYPYLRQNRGIAFSHTSHTGMGTDWRDNDPELEPLVEIYQGMRTSAEYEGAPKSPTSAKPETHQGGFRPLGFVWNAWAKGYKLGVQASSDHISTHISYSCILAEELSRDGLMDAMRRRHAYAATDNIILDVRMQDGNAEYLQGDAFTASGSPRLWVRVIGTRPIKEIQIIKNNRFVFQRVKDGQEVEFTYSDAVIEKGESYYYVRVLQNDDQIAWSSPIWVTYR